MISAEKRDKAVDLRVNGRKSLTEIQAETGISRGRLSELLRNFPLSNYEIASRRSSPPVKERGEPSKHYLVTRNETLSRSRKCKIAESAVLFRLVLRGFNVYQSVFDGDKYDCLVEVPISGDIFKIQVKSVKEASHGLPLISLQCVEGHNKQRTYKEGEFDYIVGYDLLTDVAYVYSYAEVKDLIASKTVDDTGKEAWQKLIRLGATGRSG